jgi:hypothetical protein
MRLVKKQQTSTISSGTRRCLATEEDRGQIRSRILIVNLFDFVKSSTHTRPSLRNSNAGFPATRLRTENRSKTQPSRQPTVIGRNTLSHRQEKSHRITLFPISLRPLLFALFDLFKMPFLCAIRPDLFLVLEADRYSSPFIFPLTKIVPPRNRTTQRPPYITIVSPKTYPQLAFNSLQ